MPFIIILRDFLEKLIAFHMSMLKCQVVQEIQRSIVLSLVDDEYCLISLLVHLYSGFKESTNYLDLDMDRSFILCQMNDFEKRLEQTYSKLTECFERVNKFCTLINNRTFVIDKRVITYIRSIPVLERRGNFTISKYLSYSSDIYGIRIPRPYSEATKTSGIFCNFPAVENS